MIFVDTSFFYALYDEDDFEHDPAVSLIEGLKTSYLVTTNHVMGETWTLLNRRLGHRAAAAFISRLESSSTLSVNRTSREVEADAITWLRRHDEREYSFVDATSFAFMKSRGIGEALAFDGDFTAAGFVELRS